MTDPKQQVAKQAINEYMSGELSRRGFMRRLGMVGIGVAASSTLLAACAETAEKSGPDANKGKPVSGGTLREGYDRELTAPDTVQNAWADPCFNALFEALVARDPEGNIVPMLAESFESSAAGWSFKLRSGLTFHSGAALTGAAVAAYFDLARDMKVGANASFWNPITKVNATADTVECVTSAPFRAFQETVCTEYSYVINTASREKAGKDWGSKTIDGTGPFTLKEFVPSQRMVVERWDDYPGSGLPYSQNKGKAYLDAIEWIPITEASQRAAEIETGNVNALKNPPSQDIDRLKSNPSLVVQEFQELSNFFLSLNVGEKQLGFDDLRVRQAISHAIDREAIVESILLGHGVATHGPIMPGNRWYSDEVASLNAFDTSESARLLDEAGWTPGGDGVRTKDGTRLSFKVMHITDTVENQVLQAIASMLQEVGVEIELDGRTSATFWAEIGNTTTAYALKWLWSSPMDVIDYFVTYLQAEGPDSDAYRAAYTAWQTAGTEEEMQSAAQTMQKLYAERLPLIPVYTPNTVWVNHENVVGWQPNQANLYPWYNDVWLAG